MPYGWHDGGWGVFWMILWWTVVVALVVLVVRWVTQSARGREEGERPKDARDILDERFARGEIGEEEYLARKRVLEESRR